MNGAMQENEAVPYFFFSYSRGDGDDYLNRFFEDLRYRVADRWARASIKRMRAPKPRSSTQSASAIATE